MKLIYHIGRYYLLLAKVFSKPEKANIYRRQVVKEILGLGVNSIPIVIIISVFMGAVITIQTAYNVVNPLIPKYYIGVGTRDSMILEFSSAIVALILAGKVGSNVASEIGTMRITEQIDALEIMGVNSACYLILPKIIAAMFFNPILTIISIFVGIMGGYLAAIATGVVPLADYINGLHLFFVPYYVGYTLTKSVVFAFLITTVSSYHGYYTSGGALEVGKCSTKAVVYSSILILLFNLVLTQLLLT